LLHPNEEAPVFQPTSAYSGFSVDDVDAAVAFYAGVLGIDVRVLVAGQMMQLLLPGSDLPVLVYGKPDHTPATFTVLNFVVDDIDTAMDGLAALGVHPTDGGQWADERQVLRGRARDMGPDIAWFADPAGNVFSVQQQ
jgi:predicted enzyme related to lactoylglutathione lyase